MLAPSILLLGGLALRLGLALQMPSGAPVVGAVLWGLASDLGLALVLGLPLWHPRGRIAAWAIRGISAARWFAWLFWLLIQFFYFSEFGTRPDQIVIDYVFYTAEVSGNVWESYPVVPLLTACGVVGVAIAALVARFGPRAATARWRLGQAVAGLALVGVALVPPPIADRTARELARNGFVSLAQAAITGELDYGSHYRALPRTEAREMVRERLRSDPEFDGFVGAGIRRRITPAGPPRALNVVLVISESLGRELTGEAGSPLTPNLDRLARSGLLYTRVYATGTRTARALEGALASFPPIPGNAIVRLQRQRPVDTLPLVLKRRGYRTEFVYGGSLGFDNMASFLAASGFDERIEKAGCDKPNAFINSWGAADEFAFDRVLEEMRRARAEQKPLFLTFLSVSNHRPFLFPAGRVEGQQRTREGAVRYADWALGRFFDQAQREGFDRDTLFVVIGDHGPRSYTREKLPADAHRVPLLLWGPEEVVARGARNAAIGSTIDVAPTVLGALGQPYVSSFFGRDLARVGDGGLAPLQDKRDLGLLTAEGIAAIGFNANDEFLPVDGEDHQSPAQPFGKDDPRERLGVAFFQSAYELYSEGLLVASGE